MALPHVVYHWRDNNQKRAENKLYFTGPLDYTAIAARAAAMAVVLQGASDARLAGYDVVFPQTVEGAPPAAPESSSRVYALLFYRNDSRVSSIRVPSPGRLLTEDTGPYAGCRYTRTSVELSGLLDTFEAIAPLLVDRLGRPYPTTFSVGGRVEV